MKFSVLLRVIHSFFLSYMISQSQCRVINSVYFLMFIFQPCTRLYIAFSITNTQNTLLSMNFNIFGNILTVKEKKITLMLFVLGFSLIVFSVQSLNLYANILNACIYFESSCKELHHNLSYISTAYNTMSRWCHFSACNKKLRWKSISRRRRHVAIG